MADELKVVIKVEAGQSIAVLHKTDGEIVELGGDVGKLNVSLAELDKAQKAVTASFKAASTVDQRKAYAALEQQIKGTGQQLDKAARSQDQFGGSSNRASNTLYIFSQAAEDAQYGMRGVQNNIPQLIQNFSWLSKESGGTKSAFKSLLGASVTLGGAAGLVGLGITVANVTGLTDFFASSLGKVVGGARASKKEIEGLADALLTYEAAVDSGFLNTTPEEAAATLQALRDELEVIKGDIETVSDTRFDSPIRRTLPGLKDTRDVIEEMIDSQKELVDTLGAQERVVRRIRSQGQETAGDRREREAAEKEAEKARERAEREALQRSKEVVRERQRFTEQAIANEQTARRELIGSEHERALQAIRDEYAERISLAQSVGRDTAVLEQAREAEIRRADEERADNQEALYRRVVATLERDNEALFKEQAAQDQQLFDARIENIQRENETRARLARETAREAERQIERQMQQIARYAGSAFDGVVGAFESAIAGGDLSDTEIELQKQRFDEEERALRDSLNKRGADQEKYALQLRSLEEERAEFSKRIEADRAGFVTNSLLALSGVAKQAALDVLKAELVKAASKAVGSVFETPIPFPLNVAAAGGAYLAVLGLESAITSAAGFADGGPVVGPGGPREDRIPVWLSSGEHVITAKAAQGQQRELRALNGLMERGVSLREVMNAAGLRRADGGPIGLLQPDRLALPSPAVSSFDDSRTVAALERNTAETRAMRRDLDRYSQRPSRLEAPRRTGRRMIDEAEHFARLKDPRRRS